jgi:hypothetical protein
VDRQGAKTQTTCQTRIRVSGLLTTITDEIGEAKRRLAQYANPPETFTGWEALRVAVRLLPRLRKRLDRPKRPRMAELSGVVRTVDRRRREATVATAV